MAAQQQWSLFWCKLFYPLIYQERQDVTAYLKEISEQEIIFPNGKLKKPSLATLWRKWRAYRYQGYEGLARQPRRDQGKIRAVDQEILDRAIEIKKDLPSRSAWKINEFLGDYYGKTIAESTLYRHLRHAGATRSKLGATKKKVRCRWTRNHSNSLWLGDIEYGPNILVDGQARKTYLSAFIDAHSRFIVDARYYLRENTAVLIDNLLRAWSIRGVPRAIHLDNAKIYYSEQLLHACASLEIKLLHRPPREPEPGGLIEKFFQSAQSLFESEVRAGYILNLDQLNRALSAWINVSYHHKPIRETGQTPHERYHNDLEAKRTVDMDVAIRFFMKKAHRKVHGDFSDVSVLGRLYRVDPKLRGDKVVVHWDEFSEMKTVLIYSLRGEYLGKGHFHRREKQQQSAAPTLSQKSKPKHDYLALVMEKHQQQLQRQSQGIDYTHATQSRQWPFLKFIAAMARLLGRKGGTSSFSTSEFEELNKIYHRFPDLNESVLCEAFENAEHKNIVNIAYQLQLFKKGE